MNIPSFADLRSMGFFAFLSQAYLVGKPRWSTDQIPDQSGRVAVITGGNGGIGKETAKALLQHNAKVYLACRNKDSAQSAIKELKELTGKEALFLPLDLADLNSVRAAAEEFMGKEKALHILFNNAGVMFCPMNVETNGYDMQIHANVIGHFYLTKLLLPALLSASEGSPHLKARVITVSSSGHYMSPAVALDFNTFKCGPARNKRTTEDMYIQSKFANIVFARELAHRYGEQGIVSMSVNPGNLKTDLNRYMTNPFKRLIMACLQIYPATWGALTQLWAGTAPEAAELNGKFLIPWARVGTPRPDTQDPKLGRDLWEWLSDQIPNP